MRKRPMREVVEASVPIGNGRPTRDIVAKLIPLGCKCSWSWSHTHKAMQLKYHHAACPIRHTEESS